MRLALLSAMTMMASLVAAQTTSPANHSPADAAKAFTLDLPATDTTASAVAPPPISDGAKTIVAFTLDTPIGQLLADPQAKAVLDKNLPGLSDDANLPKFELLSLRQFQPMTGGQLGNALLAKTGADLAAIDAHSAVITKPMPTPEPQHSVANRKMDSGR